MDAVRSSLRKIMETDLNKGMAGAGGDRASGLATMTSSIEFADNYTAWIVRNFRPYIGKRILEIGTGHGNFGAHFRGADKFTSADISEEAVAKARVKNPCGSYVTADVESDDFIERVGGPGKYDTAICLNVLEHVQDDRKAVRNMLGSLESGGRFLALAPAFGALMTDLDRLAGHYRRYTAASLRAAIPAGSCEIEKLEYFNPVGGAGWWLNRFVRHRDIDSGAMNAQVRFFDRYVLPVSMALNPLTRRFFGQSILCVARKI